MNNNCYNNKTEVREIQIKESRVDVQTVYRFQLLWSLKVAHYIITKNKLPETQ